MLIKVQILVLLISFTFVETKAVSIEMVSWELGSHTEVPIRVLKENLADLVHQGLGLADVITIHPRKHSRTGITVPQVDLLWLFVCKEALEDRLHEELESLAQTTRQTKVVLTLQLNLEGAAFETPCGVNPVHKRAVTFFEQFENIKSDELLVVFSSVVPAKGVDQVHAIGIRSKFLVFDSVNNPIDDLEELFLDAMLCVKARSLETREVVRRLDSVVPESTLQPLHHVKEAVNVKAKVQRVA